MHPDVKHFMDVFNQLIKESEIADGFFFIGHTVNAAEIEQLRSLRFDCINIVRFGEYRFNREVIKRIPWELFKYKILKKPLVIKYSFISKFFVNEKLDLDEDIIPSLIPNWDHTPRSGKKGCVYQDATPELFQKHVTKALNVIKHKRPNRQILFLKSWNEWGEGNYMEPDLKYGKGYINALRSSLAEVLGV
jgi:hypothetical protein